MSWVNPTQVAAQRRGAVGFASVAGTVRAPHLLLHFVRDMRHHATGEKLGDWVRGFGGAHWEPQERAWIVPGLNVPRPSVALMEAGFELDWDARPAEFADIPSIDHLATPVSMISANRRTVMVRPRLLGLDGCRDAIGLGAVWDQDRGLFRIDTADVLTRDERGDLVVRPGVHWQPEAIDEAYARHTAVPVPAHLEALARDLSRALNRDGFADDQLAQVGTWPAGGRAPLPYQVPGSYAVAAGRRCLFDEPGVGKTAGSLYAARILEAKRTLIVVPPLLTTNWAREIELAGLTSAENVAMFRAGRKEPALPDEGAVVIADSLLASRPATAARIAEWHADVMIVDEAHRIKTIGSARGDAVLDVATSVKHAPIVLTGTPMFQSPNEMVPLLELARVMAPVFGGRHQFLSDFCNQDNFGRWKPRLRALPRLQATLAEHVWVRRRKKDVLPGLPPKLRQPVLLDVPLTKYRAAHKEAVSKVKAWLTLYAKDHGGNEPTEDEVRDWTRNSGLTLISQMRQAAGVSKIDPAVDIIADHVEGTGWTEDAAGRRIYNRPLIAWVHHRSVASALIETLEARGIPMAIIAGNTSDADRDRIVDSFQEGLIPVLVGSIVKAGVGITLTRGSDAMFVETDWTPATLLQAEDRQHRIGQEASAINIQTLIARGTLDEMIQRLLGNKVDALSAALGDDRDSVALLGEDDTAPLSEIVAELVKKALPEWRKENAKTRS